MMRFAAGISVAGEVEATARELVAEVSGKVAPPADLAVLFFTSHLRPEAARLAEAVRAAVQPRVLIGCSCEGVIGVDREVETIAGASLLVGSVPGVTLQPFQIAGEEWRSLLEDDERLQQRVGTGAEHRAQIVLADPFTTPVDLLLQALDRTFPGQPTLGGMASAARRMGQNALLLNNEILNDGVVGVGIGGALQVDTVVSQGCRPIGSPMVITRAHENVIEELGRRSAWEAAEAMLHALPPGDVALVQENGLWIGVVIDEYRERFGRGDFLVRNLLGADRETGSLIVGDVVRAGQTIQFHVRDAASADEDLHLLMKAQREESTPPAGALLFSCNGRGVRLFEQPHHDVTAILHAVPNTPIAGFFAAGELGPIGGRCFLHGHTASVALFRPLPSTGAAGA
jgi:small ligand-binding sensory domain FIST